MTDIFSARIRWVAIATGVASALALFPALFLLYPSLLIAGGLMQPRFPTAGKWLRWAGAANLWVLVIVYDAMMIQDAWSQTKASEYMVLTFLATTVLLIWCSVELAANALERMRARRSTLPAEPRPVSLGLGIFAVVLNFLLGWIAAGWVLAPSRYRHAGDVYPFAVTLLQVLPVVVFDIYLVSRVFSLRPARRAVSV